MKLMWYSLPVLLLAGVALAQPAGYPPPGYGYPYYGGGYHAATAEESAMNGMANLTSAQGSYNLQTAQAAVYATQAQSQEIANHQQYANTYFQMREQRDAYEATKRVHPSEEQLAYLAREAAPKPLTPDQVNAVSGQVKWPTLLQYPSFEAERQELTSLLEKKATNGDLGYQDVNAFIQTADDMNAKLKSGIQKVPPQQYVEASSFLKSLLYQTCQVGLQ
ncbi:hypothetical protein LOC68_02390 [Blastopirellula sp. JC732]|uniref:Uncharacterized protein n=1 Tax=Blastopirellula sediminis TaxID=2894196 RepID=A0A9X1MJU5_9BACT|nr:hypothetical protein [Blastopirellula sediminis]MCC9607960.1 hypothetical protein [Blastopirellula sediminis]MCC9627247.1 hypothetical protein [Blastopirellula sediminis]